MYFYAQINKIILNKHTLLIFIWQKFCNFKKMTLAFDKAKRCFVVFGLNFIVGYYFKIILLD